MPGNLDRHATHLFHGNGQRVLINTRHLGADLGGDFLTRLLQGDLHRQIVFFQRRVGFHEQGTIKPPYFHRLIDDAHRGADGHHGEEAFDILRIHAHAAMGDAHADAKGLVGAVDQIARYAQTQGKAAQRIIGTARNHIRQDIAFLGMLGLDRGWRPPGRINVLGNDLGGALRRLPVHAADTHWIGMHYSLLARSGLGIVVQTHFRDVEDDAIARRIRQDVAGWQHDRRTGAGHPAIHARIGMDDFVIAEAVAAGDIEQGVFLIGVDNPDLTDDLGIR